MIYVIGFTAQLFFSARILVQWIASERAKKVLSPSLFWIFSLMGAYLLFIYGWLRDDFSIMLGQFVSYYIYIWNLQEKGIWKKVYPFVRIIVMATPLLAIYFVLRDTEDFVNSVFLNDKIPLGLLLFGSAGQIIFTLRFVYQFFYSYRKHESSLPATFWLMSLVGSGIIICYGIFRHDPVLILGQSVGFVAYLRNILLSKIKDEKKSQDNEA
ncbi:MAG: lipid-A-disaccharide synthase N-terminal domain-containing protein [Dysgonamonadaceae bacterium]|jgi:lipid-A-disaccharide synthase-like uncharacterized protein|nr:lipid-A-disaccharide synthase N-terminal domain-containing protein [Dysgonamonadaceae bacterium]